MPVTFAPLRKSWMALLLAGLGALVTARLAIAAPGPSPHVARAPHAIAEVPSADTFPEDLATAADSDDPEAGDDLADEQNELGESALEAGHYSEAVKCFRRAAMLGNTTAAGHLGEMFEAGQGLPKDGALALRWQVRALSEDAPEPDDATRALHVADMFERGLAGRANRTEATALRQKYALLGDRHAEALALLDEMTTRSSRLRTLLLGIPGLPATASWEDRLIRLDPHDDPDGIQALRCMVKPTPDPGDLERIRRAALPDRSLWVRLGLAADRSLPEAQCYLGFLYRFGYGVDPDPAVAREWYQLAAQRGCVNALLQLAGLPGDPTAQLRQAAQEHHSAMAEYLLGKRCCDLKKPEEARRWWTMAAEQGLSAAQYDLGYLLLSEPAIASDSEAATWFRRAGESYDAKADYNLGWLVFNRRATTANDGFALLKQAADAGIPEAQCTVGICYREGTLVSRDSRRALAWFRAAAARSLPEAQCALGQMAMAGEGLPRDDHMAARFLARAADQEDGTAQVNLGFLYEKGQGVQQSDQLAVHWYREAANHGIPEATYNMGWMYLHGRGVGRNATEAARWFRLASDQGVARAQNMLGLLYARGEGVSRDAVQAVQWYRRSAEQGDAKGMYEVGVAFLNGEGVATSDTDARRWFEQAAERGLDRAQYNLGWMCEQGRGGRKDLTQARILYGKSAEQGLAVAQCALGAIYADGKGVRKDSALAETWFLRAARQALMEAQANLGALYEEKDGPHHVQRALKWYGLAAAQGDAESMFHLGMLYLADHDRAHALRWLKRSAEAGYKKAGEQMGRLRPGA